MPLTEMVVMVAIAAAIVLAFIHIVRLLGTLVLHRTIRKMAESDPAAAQGLVAQLAAPAQGSGDDRLSTILVAIGIAMIVGSIVIGDPRWMHYAVAGALFPLIVGTALWLRQFMLERARRRGSHQ
jgi:hypothetical protein